MILVTCSSFSSTVVHFSTCVFHFIISTATLHQMWQCHVMSSHGLLHILPIIPELFPILCISHYSQNYSSIISSGLLMSHPRTCALTNGVQQPAPSPPSVFPAKNRRSEIAVALKAKLKWTIFREFPGYWWFF